MATTLQKLFLTVFLAGMSWAMPALVFAQNVDTVAEGHFLYLEREVERQIRALVGAQLKPEQYIVIVDAERSTAPEAGGNEAQTTLPYTALQVEQSFLKNVLNKSRAKDILSGSLRVQLIFDQDVPEQTQTSLQEKISKYLLLDGNNNRSLEVKSEAIIPPPKASRDLEYETAKLQLEQAKLEMERKTLEASRQAAQLEENLRRAEEDRRKAQEEAEEQMKAAAEEAKATAEEAKREADEKIKELQRQQELDKQEEPSLGDKPMLDILKEFQLLVVSFLAVLFALVGVFLAANFHKKGLQWLSDAVSTVGDGIGKMAAAQQAAADAASGGGMDGLDSGGTEAGGDSGELVSAGEATTADTGDEEKFRQFLALVEQKIEQFSSDGNFNFYRHFMDMIDADIKLAVSMLLSVDAKLAKKLLTDIAQEYLDKVRDYLSEPGAIESAKKLRSKALQEFYGRITLDEFMDSPLLEVKDAAWLFRLSNDQLRELAMELDDKERVAFLASFTPNRLALIVQETTDERERTALLNSIKDVDQITSEQISGLFDKIRQKAEGKKAETSRKLVDGPSFFAKMLMDLKPETRSNFLSTLGDRQDLIAGMQKYYIPFDTVAKLAEGSLKTLFAKRPAKQLATLMYSSNEAIREKIISAVPEQLRDSVKEELDSLLADESMAKRLEKQSLRLQDEVAGQMLQMNKQGMLEFGDSEDGSPSVQAAA